MKVTVIGGGSTYTPELVSGFIARADAFPLTELWLMDVSPERLDVVGRFAQRMAEVQGASFAVCLSTDLREAIRDASYVITQLRVGGMAARRADEYLGQRHDLIGQETTGVGGMAMALRTIPVLLDVAREMRRSAPGALLVNFTNPSGLITEALSRYAPDVPAVGLCNVAITAKMEILDALAEETGIRLDPGRAHLDTLGLNHLSWHRGLVADGEDLWPSVIEGTIATLKAAPDPEWDPRMLGSLRMIPNYYLHYYYNTAHKRSEQDRWPPSRAEQVMAIETDLLRQYAEPDRTEPPDGLMARGGAYYSTMAAQLLSAHHNDLGEVHVVNVPHRGAVPGWPTDWVLELPCRVDRAGIHPLPARPLPLVCFGLLAAVKAYELLTVEAAVHGDRNAAYQALLVHPLGPPAGEVQDVLDDLLETGRAGLPQFARPRPAPEWAGGEGD
jgi:6-phospho-beta-glucosidase